MHQLLVKFQPNDTVAIARKLCFLGDELFGRGECNTHDCIISMMLSYLRVVLYSLFLYEGNSNGTHLDFIDASSEIGFEEVRDILSNGELCTRKGEVSRLTAWKEVDLDSIMPGERAASLGIQFIGLIKLLCMYVGSVFDTHHVYNLNLYLSMAQGCVNSVTTQ